MNIKLVLGRAFGVVYVRRKEQNEGGIFLEMAHNVIKYVHLYIDFTSKQYTVARGYIFLLPIYHVVPS